MGEPRILIVQVENWLSTPRLPAAIKAAGFGVAALCPPNFYLGHSRHLDFLFALHNSTGGRLSISVAIIVALDSLVADPG